MPTLPLFCPGEIRFPSLLPQGKNFPIVNFFFFSAPPYFAQGKSPAPPFTPKGKKKKKKKNPSPHSKKNPNPNRCFLSQKSYLTRTGCGYRGGVQLCPISPLDTLVPDLILWVKRSTRVRETLTLVLTLMGVFSAKNQSWSERVADTVGGSNCVQYHHWTLWYQTSFCGSKGQLGLG